jgi:nucleoside-diphosphate-sugar epimerase
MKILVTGATGFVGRAVVEELIANGEKKMEVHTTGARSLEKAGELPRYKRIDITKPENFRGVFKTNKISAVVHSAGLAHQFQAASAGDFYKINVLGTKNVLEFAADRSAEHFVLISSVAVYGSSGENGKDGATIQKITEDAACFPQNEYARSKLDAEKEAVRFCIENKIALTILRPATVIGEDDAGNVSRLIAAIDGRRFLMPGKGENLKTLIYKKDAARACRIILEKKDFNLKQPEIFNVAAEPVSMKFIVGQIYGCLGRKPPDVFIPIRFLSAPLEVFARLPVKKIRFLRDFLKKWASDEVFSGERIFQKYSFKPETTVAEALEREVISYRKRKQC